MLALSKSEEEQLSVAVVTASNCLARAAVLATPDVRADIAEAQRLLALAACALVAAVRRQGEMADNFAAVADSCLAPAPEPDAAWLQPATLRPAVAVRCPTCERKGWSGHGCPVCAVPSALRPAV